MTANGPIWVEELDTVTMDPDDADQVELYDVATARSNKHTAMLGVLLAVDLHVDQPAAAGTAIPVKYLPKVLSQVSLVSKLKCLGALYPSSLGGTHLYNVIGARLAGATRRTGFGDRTPDVPAADGDYHRTFIVPMLFADGDYADPTDFAIPPQAFRKDVIRLKTAGAAVLDGDSTGAVWEHLTIRPYAVMTLRDDAVIPVIRQWSLHTRSTNKHKLGAGLYTDAWALTDIANYGFGSTNGADLITGITVERDGQYSAVPVTGLLAPKYASGEMVGYDHGAFSTGDLADANLVALPILSPGGGYGGKAKLTHTHVSGDPLTIEYAETGLSMTNLIAGELLPQTDERIREFCREVFELDPKTISPKPKRLRPGTPDAQLDPAKRLVLPYTVR